MKILLLCATTVAIGCGVSISDGARTGGGDGGGGHGEPDANQAALPPDAPTCSNGRVVFLDFGGVTLKSAQGKSDAAANAAHWLGAQHHVPPFRANAGTRANDIAAVTAAVKAGLARFPISVVTARPTTGPYVMVAFGGSSKTDFGFDREYYAINSLDCGDAAKSDIAWVGDFVPSNTLAADFALGAIGFGLGLSGTTDPTTCMCGWGSTCDSADVPCTFSATAPVAPLCQGGANSEDELGAFDTAFCKPLS